MTVKQVKTVSISKTVQTGKTGKVSQVQVTVGNSPAAANDSKIQPASKVLKPVEMPAVNIENQGKQLVILLDKYTVEADFFDEVESQFCEIYPSLLDDVDYTPAELVGELFWANLTDLGKRVAILCLKHLATEPDVPLVDLTCVDCGITRFAIV